MQILVFIFSFLAGEVRDINESLQVVPKEFVEKKELPSVQEKSKAFED